MTINKSEGQSLSHVGLYFHRPVFTHGQLYVALDENHVSTTTNVVYQEILQNV